MIFTNADDSRRRPVLASRNPSESLQLGVLTRSQAHRASAEKFNNESWVHRVGFKGSMLRAPPIAEKLV